jgi:hypothetical protein
MSATVTVLDARRAALFARRQLVHGVDEARHFLELFTKSFALGEPIDPAALHELALYLDSTAELVREAIAAGAR